MRHLHPACLLATGLVLLLAASGSADEEPGARGPTEVRGIYGGVPEDLMKEGRTLASSGVNAIWIGERWITPERVATLHEQGARVFAEFNTLHDAEYLEEHPDAAPVGPDGEIAEAPHGWQGVCPTHEGYRRERMEAFRTLLADHEIDGVWLDYHHAHAAWERADPLLPDTCFCDDCLARFQEDTGLESPQPDDGAWIRWRCALFTDWVREFREILDAVRPEALLGTFHCPWSEDDHDGALRAKLAIDLRAQAKYLDVFSPMPYHARFGHADNPAWISRQTAWLGAHLGPALLERRGLRIWPIVQLSDWGESVPAEQVAAVLDHGTRAPASGVMAFAWGSLRRQPAKVEAMVDTYRELANRSIPLAFEHDDVTGRLRPRYSPKGSRVPLAERDEGAPESFDALEGRLPVGPTASRGEGLRVVLARSAEGGPYDQLWVDTNGDGSLEDETLHSASPSTKRESVYTSFDVLLRVQHGPDEEPYPIGLWVAVEAAEETPPFVRYSRRGFLVAPAMIDGNDWSVVLSDADNDGVYGEDDWWALLPATGDAVNDSERMRKVGDFAWAGGLAFRFELEGTRGREGRLVAFDPGLTPAEDARKRDWYWDDKHAARADAPLAFRRDVDAALEEAKQQGIPFFLDFETEWCGPCKLMDRWVYTAQDVVTAAEGVLCIKIDGDEREDLKERYGVKAFPTGILFDADGAERGRFRGYQSVTDLEAFFAALGAGR